MFLLLWQRQCNKSKPIVWCTDAFPLQHMELVELASYQLELTLKDYTYYTRTSGFTCMSTISIISKVKSELKRTFFFSKKGPKF